ncbi:hypothetical protein FQN52_005378 [Onygenales sp. PD_12]|nr:hypothetical protein FQN52_005378 [Onygenales sp. PD_12]
MQVPKCLAIPVDIPSIGQSVSVSPANSYARLDGAFDDAISRLFCLPEHEYNTLTRALGMIG